MRNGIIAANRLVVPGLSMSTSVDQKTKLINSLLFAAQIIGTMNSAVQEALKKHSKDLFNTVRANDMALVNQQCKSTRK
jgi:phosphoribosylcarboxyaminoimidazole (NCAIR) mutase